MRKHISKVTIMTICAVGLCCLATLRFQRVQVEDRATARTNHYWRVLLPGQDTSVTLERDGSFEARTYDITGLYGLLGGEDVRGFRRTHH
jgi:hypothetical protein